MRRRKLLIGIGAAAAGGSAAFGTEAFTSVQAERNVDVSVAGDQSSFIAIQPLSSENADEYVNTESGDNTVELELDGDNSGPGEGVTQDAVTQLEDLFRVVNQGSQPVSVYFEDDSDAVTFRVSGSADGFSGSGQSLEGPDNSAELAVGEQVVVGMTVDTLNNDVSGQLLDRATLYADASASAPEQTVPEPQYVVDPTAAESGGSQPAEDNTHATIASALQAARNDDQSGAGAVIGIRGDAGSSPLTPSSLIDIDLDGVTITGFEGTPTIDGTQDLPSSDTVENLIQASGDNVTLQNLTLKADADIGPNVQQGILASGDGVTIEGVTVNSPNNADNSNGDPLVDLQGQDPTVTNSEVTNGPIAVDKEAGGTVTITNNYVNGVIDEGIWAYAQTDSGDTKDFVIENNLVENHDANRNGNAEIKVGVNGPPDEINGETSTEDQLNAILEENDVKTAQVDGDIDTIGGDGITANFQNDGNFSPISINKSLNANLIADSGGGFDELEIHGATGGNNAPIDESLSGSETDFTVTLDPGANTVELNAAGATVTDEDVTDGEGSNGDLNGDTEFPDGVPSTVDIAVNLISRNNKVAVKDLSINGADAEVSGYKMATSGPLKVFEFTDVPADGMVTVEGTVFIGSGGGQADSLGIDFADPDDV
ncbi:hypothetical protein [Halorubrum sp. Atlit-26R]|uniref:hypothetical protein n=1 Tax=Halorubrum sp. Atlit-26R TaxID=2282128 RepID=UPI0011C3DDA6|nr:hypothetical protein [Halorubrum sp. Atlit-26R]